MGRKEGSSFEAENKGVCGGHGGSMEGVLSSQRHKDILALAETFLWSLLWDCLGWEQGEEIWEGR